MLVADPKGLLFFVLAIATVWIAFFVCWVLFEIAKLIQQTNTIVEETRDRLHRFEDAVMSVKERLESSTKLIAALVSGGKMLSSFVRGRKRKNQKEE